MPPIAAPTITSILDLSTGSSVRVGVTYPAEAASLLFLHRQLPTRTWTATPAALAATVDIESLTEGKLLELMAVAIDDAGGYSLPTVPSRIVPTSSGDTIHRRVELDVIATIEAITEAEGAFDTVESVYRFDHPEDTRGETGMFALVAFTNVRHEEVGWRGADIVDDCTIEAVIGMGRKGVNTSDPDWVPDSEAQMLAAISAALAEDRTRSGLAVDTLLTIDELSTPIDRMADAVVASRYEIRYRTHRLNPYALAQ